MNVFSWFTFEFCFVCLLSPLSIFLRIMRLPDLMSPVEPKPQLQWAELFMRRTDRLFEELPAAV
jgi:hypothetical protein